MPPRIIPILGRLRQDIAANLTKETIEEACRQMEIWQSRFSALDLKMNINVSARQIQQSDVVADMRQAMDNHGLSLDWYVHRHRTDDEVLPWDHLSAGLHKDFLWQDWRDALAEVGLPDCRWTPCYDCGACTGYGIEHIVASATPPAGGSQGTGQLVFLR